jgi:hypothetical protein
MDPTSTAIAIYVTWDGVEQVELPARTKEEEFASLSLYSCIRPALDEVERRLVEFGRRPKS